MLFLEEERERERERESLYTFELDVDFCRLSSNTDSSWRTCGSRSDVLRSARKIMSSLLGFESGFSLLLMLPSPLIIDPPPPIESLSHNTALKKPAWPLDNNFLRSMLSSCSFVVKPPPIIIELKLLWLVVRSADGGDEFDKSRSSGGSMGAGCNGPLVWLAEIVVSCFTFILFNKK